MYYAIQIESDSRDQIINIKLKKIYQNYYIENGILWTTLKSGHRRGYHYFFTFKQDAIAFRNKYIDNSFVRFLFAIYWE